MRKSTIDWLTQLQQEKSDRKKKSLDQRRYIRFDDNQGKQIHIRIKDLNGDWVEPHAFINNESFGGLGLLIVSPIAIAVHQPCQVKIPEIGWVQGQVAWIKCLHDSLLEVGLKYCYDSPF